jgi:CarD family transcriptional regulator
MALKTQPKKKAAAKKATPAKSSQKAAAKAKASSRAPHKKAPAKKAPAKKAPVKKATPKAKSPGMKVPAKTAPKSAVKKAPTKAAVKKTARPRPVAKKPAASPAKGKPPAKAEKTSKTEKTSTDTRGASAKAAATKKPSPVSDGNREHAPAPVKRAPVSSKYGVGDKVVHPQHGAATIAKRLKREFAGEVRDYFVLDIATESLTVMVPVDKIDSVVRSVISKTHSRHVLNSLRDEPQEAGANWSRWYKVLTEKMYSGDINQVAEVVRDLTFAQQTKGISPALKRMLSKARMTLISELSFSLEVDEEEATRRLDKALPQIDEPVLPPA